MVQDTPTEEQAILPEHEIALVAALELLGQDPIIILILEVPTLLLEIAEQDQTTTLLLEVLVLLLETAEQDQTHSNYLPPSVGKRAAEVSGRSHPDQSRWAQRPETASPGNRIRR